MNFSFCSRRVIAVALCMLLQIGPWTAGAQQSQKKKPATTNPAPTTTPPPAAAGTPAKPATDGSAAQNEASRDQAVAEFESRLAGVFDGAQDDSDYVPCFFTVKQLMELRPNPPTSRLTGGQADTLKSAVIAEVLSPASLKIFGEAGAASIVDKLNHEDFEGLSSSQALAIVIRILHEATIEEKLSAAELIQNASAQAKLTAQAKLSQDAAQKQKTPDPASQKAVDAEIEKYMQYLNQQNFSELTGTDAASAVAKYSDKYAKTLTAAPTAEAAGTPPEKGAAPVASDVQKATLAGIEDASKKAKVEATDRSSANAAVASSARSLLSNLQRPLDIACAMSVLSWSETRFAFGRMIANEYVGVQIIVRNVNEKQEFLLQDAALAVDSDLNGRKGRYFSGRDRIIVRALTVDQKDDSPRNLFMNAITSVGTIMTTVVPFVGAVNFADATTAFNAGLVPGLGKIWTDNTTDQIKMLDDIGFSSAMNQKTVVPKSGTVMFVMFVPQKPFQQGWWTQPCAETISSGELFNPPDDSWK